LFKKTETTHPDYKNIEEALEKIKKVISQINRKMQKYSKIAELQTKFGNPENIKIYDRKRSYLGEAKVKLITSDLLATSHKDEMVTMYMLSDMILIGGT
jgi:hypothetical protein